MKKILAFALAAIMLMSLMVGCGGGKEPEIVEEPEGHITLTVGVPQSANISSYTDNDFTKWIEEQIDVTLDFVYYSGNTEEANQQFSLDCAAGKEIPDVIWGFHGMSNYNLGDLGEDGYVLDLNPYLETNFPHFQEALKDVPERDRKIAVEKGTNPDDGGYYGMPLIALEHVDNMAFPVFINKVWLDKVGKEMPTTVDELYDVLVAFRDGDCNGNGKKDEIPMVSAAGSCTGLAAWVMNAYMYWDPSNIYNVDDNGKIYSPIVTDEFRQGLKFLNKLYEEGLVSELCWSGASYTDFVNINTPADQVAKAGIWFGHPSIYTDANTTILDQYDALAPLKDATGKGGWTVFQPNVIKWISWITTSCEYPYAAMRFLDLMYTDEAMARMRMGEKGVFWDYGEEGVNIKGEKTSIHVYDSSAFFTGNSTWGINGNSIMNDANYTGVEEEYAAGTRDAETQRIMKQLWENVCMKRVQPEEIAANLIYTTEDFNRRQELMSRYWGNYNEPQTLFITGGAPEQYDIDNDEHWEAYKSTLDQLGREELEGIAQRAYDREKSGS